MAKFSLNSIQVALFCRAIAIYIRPLTNEKRNSTKHQTTNYNFILPSIYISRNFIVVLHTVN